MRTTLLITALFLLPALALLNPQISLEKLGEAGVAKMGDPTRSRQKLEEIGYESLRNYENFRLKQASLMFAFALPAMTYLFLVGKAVSIILSVGALCAISTIFVTERHLTSRVRRHKERIEADFSPIVEMLTLALSAGESPLSALNRIASTASGPLAQEFSVVVEETRAGKPFVHALDDCSKRLSSLTIRRFIDALVIAISRGAPLIEVLHSHTKESREFQRNQVLAASGKAEIAMMIPIVFLILPISILFALWPSLANLNLYAGG